MAKNLTRREVLKAGGAVVAVGGLNLPPKAGEVAPELPSKIRKGKLLQRGVPEVYTGAELRFIGMPVGGLFAGTVYLGGDGQLWNWDIFNQGHFGCVQRQDTVFMGETLNAGGGANYVDPVKQQSPFRQKFRLIAQERERPRDVRFGDVRFRGEYPVGKVGCRDADADVEMDLVAFSPFCPLNVADSSFPATTLTFMVKNTGKAQATYSLLYDVENPVLIHSRESRDDWVLMAAPASSTAFQWTAASKPKVGAERADVLFEDWSSGTYGKWVPTGTAFGTGPRLVKDLPTYMGDVHAGTKYVVNSHQTRNGEDVVQADAHTGTLTSPKFRIERKHINMRVGGGNHPYQTCINLLVDGKVVRTVAGHDSNVMAWESFLVGEFQGRDATLEVVDQFTGGWGQISLGEVEFSDKPRLGAKLEDLPDFGTFCVALVGGGNDVKTLPESGQVGWRLTLAPGESKEVTFIVAWHFPNCAKSLPGKKNWYASKWKDAGAVAAEIEARWPQLKATTLAWNKTWYDSTLPYWFLDRTFVNTSILATTTCHRLDDGRFYFWEGIGCCAGTCTHVWGYAQAAARVFPEIEQYLRQAIDFKKAFHSDSGAIDYRAEFHQIVATDGQASCIMRACREHLMSKDGSFLKSIWPEVKGAMTYLINQEGGQDGVLQGAQYNTLDTAWFGEIAWITSLYLGALRACEAMAGDVGDKDFQTRCASLIEKGSAKLCADLFNGEYFWNKRDPKHPEANNSGLGCHIDQVYGQGWVHQLGLPGFIPSKTARAALKNLFANNFFEDVWEYRRKQHQVLGGRWYAAPQEPGLIMCTFPKGGAGDAVGKGGDAWAGMYFNECMSGFEHQAAGHMIAEGLVEEGLTVVRAIHERYAASKRNPYNEVECSDHYGRAMASYGAFISLTGFKSHGPRGTMSFSPKVSGPARFPFINAHGWGTWEGSPDSAGGVSYAYRDGKLA